MKSFALIGASGYIAPRHMDAIKTTGNKLVAAFDPYDGVGIIDSYFPQADFFVEFERFDRHLDKLRRSRKAIDFVSICSPNYLHDSHIRFALRSGADAICEKPVVLNPWNIDALAQIEKESGKRIYSILQLRLHPSIIALREKIANGPADEIYDVDLTYITSRGNWYYTSWKGQESKSGGIATNIGIHFFDALSWIFGDVKSNEVHVASHDRVAGALKFKRANVRWFLSINSECLPAEAKIQGKTTYRSIQIGGEEWDFSTGFQNLHQTSYEQILAGNGFGIEESKAAVQIVHDIRNQKPLRQSSNMHPLGKLKPSQHPFKRI